jgi:GNAT superfamily N-acetyltransferase
VRRALRDGYELDDDPARVDLDALHAVLMRTYWAGGRPREVVERLVREATRVVGLYQGDELVGFARAVSDGVAFAYLADVVVHEDHRGGGLGVELVREAVDRGPLAGQRWLLHARDAHELYRRFGFAAPGETAMERPRRTAPSSGRGPAGAPA